MTLYKLDGFKRTELTPEEEADFLKDKPVEADDLAARKEFLMGQVDSLAAGLRNRQQATDDTASEAEVYGFKRDEARAWLADANRTDVPIAETYPLIAAEVARAGKTAADVIKAWLASAAAHKGRQMKYVARVDTARLNAKEAMRAAKSSAELDEVLAKFAGTMEIPMVAAIEPEPEETKA